MFSLLDRSPSENRRRPGEDDIREAPYNGGSTGTLAQIQRSEEELSSLDAIVFDLDPHLLQTDNPWFPPADEPAEFHAGIRRVLDRHPIANRAEVRATGTGLHLIARLERPLQFDTRAELRRGRALVGLIQSTLPIDPNSPGITMLTRPVGEINGKNGREVALLREGAPIPVSDLEDFAGQVSRAPFVELARILTGGVSCPMCRLGGQLYDLKERSARCYVCRQITLADLLSLPYVASEDDGGPLGGSGRLALSRPARGGRGQRREARWAGRNEAGEALESRLLTYLEEWRREARRGGRAVIRGATTRGEFKHGIEDAQKTLGDALVASGRFYLHGDSLVFDDQEGRRLVAVAGPSGATQEAPDILQNYVVLEGNDGSQHFLDGPKLKRLLASPGLRASLPRIAHYSRRPTLDLEFRLCRPGWNPESGYLVHADAVDVPDLPAIHEGPVIDRLPPLIRTLLGEFAWEGDADLVHAVSLLLTGMLVDRFVEDPHPLGLILGDGPGVGKTLLARVIGAVLDGREPRILTLSRREELPKVLGAHLDGDRPTINLFDNVRGRVDSDLLEALSVSSTVSVRRLGASQMIEVPNAMLWLFTSNQASLTPDLISRCLPIRLAGGEDMDRREYDRNPLEVARDRRPQLLGELVAMIRRWDDDGRPRLEGAAYRFRGWAGMMGGVLGSWGLGGPFLANLGDARERVDPDQASLADLARAIARLERDPRHSWRGRPGRPAGLPATGWLSSAREARGSLGRIASPSRVESPADSVGRFLRRQVDRRVEIEHEGQRLRATLRTFNRSGNRYYFEFESVDDRPGAGADC